MKRMSESIQKKIYDKYNAVNPPNIMTNDYDTTKSRITSQKSVASLKQDFLRNSKSQVISHPATSKSTNNVMMRGSEHNFEPNSSTDI